MGRLASGPVSRVGVCPKIEAAGCEICSAAFPEQGVPKRDPRLWLCDLDLRQSVGMTDDAFQSCFPVVSRPCGLPCGGEVSRKA